MAQRLHVPLVGVNHLEGHLVAINLARPPGRPVAFPFLGLLVSGGHTGLYLARAEGDYACLGRTRDDAVGEAFDKAAKLLGLGYPGGPVIDRLARAGDPTAVRFPRARVKRARFDFSFSGVKTALRLYLQEHPLDHPRPGRAGEPPDGPAAASGGGVGLADVAASLQEALIDMLVTATVEALVATGVERLVVAGGVAANGRLRARMGEAGASLGVEVLVPPPRLCTDNAAMIALAGMPRLAAGESGGLAVEAEAGLGFGAAWAG
jgi:N6-L-threonylcarbamoyladenine synthase